MAESTATTLATPIEIPIEIVSEDEMAVIEAALSSTRSVFFHKTGKQFGAIAALSSKRLTRGLDIEDFGGLPYPQKRNVVGQLLLQRPFFVTDLTGSEWCEKQMEFTFFFGKKKPNKAMKVGTSRHEILEEEVIRRVKVSVASKEDVWALKLANFIIGATQLLFEKRTRELPLIGSIDGVYVTGKLDEIRMPEGAVEGNPILVDTKTRVRDTLPSEPQRRNGRLQLMCYKILWDNLVANKFSFKQFFDFFSLDPYAILSEDTRQTINQAGIPAKMLIELGRYVQNMCTLLLPAANQMLLRYESQKDNSLLGEHEFSYDHEWLTSQIGRIFEFLHGKREANFAAEEERWKCNFCQFASLCPAGSISPSPSPPSSPAKKRTPTTVP